MFNNQSYYVLICKRHGVQNLNQNQFGEVSKSETEIK